MTLTQGKALTEQIHSDFVHRFGSIVVEIFESCIVRTQSIAFLVVSLLSKVVFLIINVNENEQPNSKSWDIWVR